MTIKDITTPQTTIALGRMSRLAANLPDRRVILPLSPGWSDFPLWFTTTFRRISSKKTG
jgi:hypothetical protein